MSYEQIVSLILNIAITINVPPYFALSIALTENDTLNPRAVNTNENGTKDRGIFQTNDSWDKSDWTDIETNIRVGITHIKFLMVMPELNTFWSVAVSYNCGHARFLSNNPPEASLSYAEKVMSLWEELDKQSLMVVIPRYYKR
jgi:soluble lytic murein transglycosylase-like protein